MAPCCLVYKDFRALVTQLLPSESRYISSPSEHLSLDNYWFISIALLPVFVFCFSCITNCELALNSKASVSVHHKFIQIRASLDN